MWVNVRKNLIERYLAKSESIKSINFFCFSFIIIFLVYFVFRVFVFDTVIVSGSSMSKTLTSDDILVVNKLIEPKRGDIVVFYKGEVTSDGKVIYDLDASGARQFYIKRIIACENETIFWKDGEVSVEIDGVLTPFYEPYTSGKTYTNNIFGFGDDNDNEIGTYVPEGHFFVMGDNREMSNDSRRIGTIDKRLILGVVPDFVVSAKDTPLRYLFKIF